jgi:hypothetical protein
LICLHLINLIVKSYFNLEDQKPTITVSVPTKPSEKEEVQYHVVELLN